MALTREPHERLLAGSLAFTAACARRGVTQSMGNGAAERLGVGPGGLMVARILEWLWAAASAATAATAQG